MLLIVLVVLAAIVGECALAVAVGKLIAHGHAPVSRPTLRSYSQRVKTPPTGSARPEFLHRI